MSNNIPAWQFNTIPGNAVQGSILLTRRDIGNPPFNQSDFTWYPMEDVVGIANIKLEYDKSSNYFKLYKAKGHINNKKKWTYEWEFVGEWKDIGFTPTEDQLIAMNSGIDGIKVEQIELNKEAITQLNSSKADKATTYDKTETDILLNNKADKSTTYTKSETDDKFVEKNLFLNTLYPTGSIIMTYIKTSPSTYIGGTWELIDEGYYPVATIKQTIDEQTERFKEAGLPNITGSLSPIYLKGDRNNVNKQGALKKSSFTNNNWGGTNSGSATNLNNLQFDASDSNSIYGKSNTVQPKSVLVYIWRRTDNDTLTYNFTNISFKESDFNVSETGQVSIKAFYPEPGEIVQSIRSSFNPNIKYAGTTWRKFKDGIYFSSGNTFEYRGEQLPNITGEIDNINFRGSSAQSITRSGAFTTSVKSNGNSIGCSTPAGDVIRSLKIDASQSNSIYTDNGKVRPNTITTYAWIRVDGLSQEEMNTLEEYLN